MTADDDRVSTAIDVTVPSSARMYDYALGGKDNYAVDRETADRIFAAFPALRELVVANRGFLQRAVRFVAEQGVRQFVDLGAGIPTSPNVHEIAREVHPDARVVYVDHDPIVAAHSRALRADGDAVTVIEADIRRPDDVLAALEDKKVIDFDEPVGILFIDVLHFITDEEDPAGIVARFRDRFAPGSHLVLSIACRDGVDPESTAKVTAAYQNATTPLIPRTREQIEPLFAGFELVPPGLVSMACWRADGPEIPGGLAGVARKPAG
ncbi:SAM-dependent methyltransferase [Actinoallomurus rhizosphaericola]|uniref:SAM-dependent methyltransferase n=1 Tax=Actinoallomurus rhizosphaericola TaxID=2952536 RepID=UPI0020904111|nr:SAM-dependent methyltransferase [Actinoallomurus rhizosphaericola]MCO5992271.1 SAM-dependent methyltransferase [Actinoallomurus rhizosphaericola]